MTRETCPPAVIGWRGRRLRARLVMVAWIGLWSGIVAILLAVMRGAIGPTSMQWLGTGLNGVLLGLLIASLEIFALGSRASPLTRWSFPAVLLCRVLFYSVIILAVDRVMAVAAGLPSAEDVLQSLLVAGAFNFVFMIRRLLGPATFRALLTGRYRQPRLEQRLVAFIDLKGSTTSAERLGELRFMSLLARVVRDVTAPIDWANGEVHRYVGDEVIATWQIGQGGVDRRCLLGLIEIQDLLIRRADVYQAAFGLRPGVRIALHAGMVAVGEIGDLKREIVLLGDAMNSAARIEDYSRVAGADFIVSAPALALLRPLPDGLAVRSLGHVALRGKSLEMELFAIGR